MILDVFGMGWNHLSVHGCLQHHPGRNIRLPTDQSCKVCRFAVDGIVQVELGITWGCSNTCPAHNGAHSSWETCGQDLPVYITFACYSSTGGVLCFNRRVIHRSSTVLLPGQSVWRLRIGSERRVGWVDRSWYSEGHLGYSADQKLNQFLDKVGKSAKVEKQVNNMNVNPKHNVDV